MMTRESRDPHDALRIIDVPIVLSQVSTLLEIGQVDLCPVLAEQSRTEGVQREVHGLENR